uniref:ABC transporter ATP-binding protein n=1 Tax=Acidobacterium capsulatum TaxID=33075 RepID=A0A7V4XRS1_9BACT
MTELAVHTQSLSKHYRTLRSVTRAVDGLTMQVPRGSIYGFLGRNGAGKTTALRMLAGLARPTAGSAVVLGLDPQRETVAVLHRTGFVIEKTLFPAMTGEELLRFQRGFFPGWSEERARRYVDALEVPMRQRFRTLSLGSKTKLCLLLALAQNPELLVLDEPTAGLDPVVTDQLLRVLIEDFAGTGRTLLLSSHHLSEVEKVADWVGIIDAGTLKLEARLDDIRLAFRRIRAVGRDLPARGPKVVTCRISGETAEYVVRAQAEEFAAELRAQGATILDIETMNLQETFLAVAGKESAHVSVEVLA